MDIYIFAWLPFFSKCVKFPRKLAVWKREGSPRDYVPVLSWSFTLVNIRISRRRGAEKIGLTWRARQTTLRDKEIYRRDRTAPQETMKMHRRFSVRFQRLAVVVRQFSLRYNGPCFPRSQKRSLVSRIFSRRENETGKQWWKKKKRRRR